MNQTGDRIPIRLLGGTKDKLKPKYAASDQNPRNHLKVRPPGLHQHSPTSPRFTRLGHLSPTKHLQNKQQRAQGLLLHLNCDIRPIRSIVHKLQHSLAPLLLFRQAIERSNCDLRLVLVGTLAGLRGSGENQIFTVLRALAPDVLVVVTGEKPVGIVLGVRREAGQLDGDVGAADVDGEIRLVAVLVDWCGEVAINTPLAMSFAFGELESTYNQ